MFKKSHKQPTTSDSVPRTLVNFAGTPNVVISQENEYRPCYVNGCRALFHRWVNTANPALPKGVELGDEKARFFQHRSTAGLVEYVDGTMARVWPQEIRFADSAARFREYDWETDEKRNEEAIK